MSAVPALALRTMQAAAATPPPAVAKTIPEMDERSPCTWTSCDSDGASSCGAKEVTAAKPFTSQSDDEGQSTCGSHDDDHASGDSDLGGGSDTARSRLGSKASQLSASSGSGAREELARLQEKQRRVMGLLHSATFPQAGAGSSSTQVNTPRLGAAPASAASGPALPASGQQKLAGLRERYLQCAGRRTMPPLHLAAVSEAAPASAERATGAAAARPEVERTPSGGRDAHMMQLTMAQAAANHALQMGELRKLQESLKEGVVARAEIEATKAKLEEALKERQELLLQNGTLQGQRQELLLKSSTLEGERQELLLQSSALQDERQELLLKSSALEDERQELLLQSGALRDERQDLLLKNSALQDERLSLRLQCVESEAKVEAAIKERMALQVAHEAVLGELRAKEAKQAQRPLTPARLGFAVAAAAATGAVLKVVNTMR